MTVCEGDWKSISKGEVNLAGSFSQFLGGSWEFTCCHAKTSQLPRRNWWRGPSRGQDKSNVTMRRCLGWPKGSDAEVLHLILISSLAGPRQVVCCHSKMSRLARRKWRWNPSHALLRKWSACEDDSVSSKEFLGRTKTSCISPCEDFSVSPKELLGRGRTVRTALK
jgi:hypothetical protein